MSCLRRTVSLSILLILASPIAHGATMPIAGLKPDRPPEGAPVLRDDTADAAKQKARLTGITKPYPGNVERIAQQGNWYSPMFRPGMHGPYDLRGWHPSRKR